MMTPLMTAKQLLNSSREATLAVVNPRTSRVFTQRGVKPLLDLATTSPAFLAGASVADKVTGAAAAFILVYAGAKELHTGVISRRAEEILTKYGISYQADTRVEYIINRRGDGFCPMETAVKDINDPAEAVKAISKTLSAMK
ncbi:MAG: DUF1893 domain-containing protein [Clostridia bacterium]|nr:DUF1893 domain-containing protein [Clostridia bacterium]